MDFNLYMPVRVLSGKDAVRQNAAELKKLGDCALIITGGRSAKLSGALKDVQEALEEAGVRWETYDQVGPNPLVSACREAGERARTIGARFIIGIGGGSPLDASKAAAVFAANGGLTNDKLFSLQWEHPALPLALVGTTAGTGSEVSAVSVLTIDETGRKKSITHPQCYARIAFADPQYTASMPRSVTVSTALDALSHATEGFLSPRCSDFAAHSAGKALPMLWEGLTALGRGESPDGYRETLYYGSLWAGLTLNAMGTAFPHPFGYVLTEDFGIPHGRACTAFLPAFVRRAAQFTPERANQYFETLGCGCDTFCELVDRLTDVHLNLSKEQAEGYLDRWEHLKHYANTPGGFDRAAAEQLLHERFGITE